jgi:hypothetical protein
MTRKLANIVTVGALFTIGKPTMAATGLGRTVAVQGFTEGNKKVIVADKEDSTKTAEVKYSNLGSIVDEDGTLRSMPTGLPWKKRQPKLTRSKIPADVADAFGAFHSYKVEMGDTVSRGKARHLGRLRNTLNAALEAAGLKFEAVEGVLVG